jgi:hypothetical protein
MPILGQFATNECRDRLLGVFAAVLGADPDQGVGGIADPLDAHRSEVQLIETGAQIGNIGIALLRLDLDQRTAGEIDAEM